MADIPWRRVRQSLPRWNPNAAIVAAMAVKEDMFTRPGRADRVVFILFE
jgi:hypothetical protein